MSLFRPYEIGNPSAGGESSPTSGHGSPSPPATSMPSAMTTNPAMAAAAAAAMFANDLFRSKLMGQAQINNAENDDIAEEDEDDDINVDKD